MEERYDICVIGAGTAGFAAAEAADAAGLRMIMISGPGDLGGTCILRGCMPAKTLLSSTERLGEVENAAAVGVDVAQTRIDVPAIINRKRELVDYFAADRLHDLERFRLVRGGARFVARDAVEVAGRRITARRFVVATGSRIAAPSIPGLPEAGYLVSDDVLDATTVPASVAVIGGGPVGCEFAQYYARLGVRVTLLQDAGHLLRNEDRDVGETVAAALRSDGVDVVLDARIEHCAKAGADTVVTYTSGESAASVHVAAVLLASGRGPNIEGLNLAAAGILEQNGRLAVDPYLRTTNPAIFAAGDIIGRRALVHVAAYTGKLAVRNAFAEHLQRADFDRSGAMSANQMGEFRYAKGTLDAGMIEINGRMALIAVRIGQAFSYATLVHESTHGRAHAEGRLSPEQVIDGEVEAYRVQPLENVAVLAVLRRAAVLFDEALNVLETGDDPFLARRPAGTGRGVDLDTKFLQQRVVLVGEVRHGRPRLSCGRGRPRPRPSASPRRRMR